jgi:hypothetical protein
MIRVLFKLMDKVGLLKIARRFFDYLVIRLPVESYYFLPKKPRAFRRYVTHCLGSDKQLIACIENMPEYAIKNINVIESVAQVLRKTENTRPRKLLFAKTQQAGVYSKEDLLKLSIKLGDHESFNKIKKDAFGDFSKTELREPDFLIIGAMRAGTSWLSGALHSHPDVYMPDYEPFYFSDNPLGWTFDQYCALFLQGNNIRVVGEKSSKYDLHVAKIVDKLPHIKLFYIVRDPFDRLISHYFHAKRRGQNCPLKQFVDMNYEECIDRGLYFKNYSSAPDHIRLLFYDNIEADPEGFFKECLDELELSTKNIKRFTPPYAVNKGSNTPDKHRYKQLLIDAGVADRVKGYYRDDIADLQREVGRDLRSKWLSW